MSVPASKRAAAEPVSGLTADSQPAVPRRWSRLVVLSVLPPLLLLLTAAAVILWVTSPSGEDLPARVSALAAAGGGTMPPAQVPVVLEHAVVAAEDERFYVHHGLDTIGTARAVLTDLLRFCACEGGSTLTQQLAKLVYYPADGRIARKLPSVVVAFKIELRYSKAQILSDYLSVVPTGYGLVGASAASCAYFGHDLSSLSVAEAAELAGMVQGPSIYDPRYNPERARARRDHVIQRMLELGYVTDEEARTAKTAPVLTPGGCSR